MPTHFRLYIILSMKTKTIILLDVFLGLSVLAAWILAVGPAFQLNKPTSWMFGVLFSSLSVVAFHNRLLLTQLRGHSRNRARLMVILLLFGALFMGLFGIRAYPGWLSVVGFVAVMFFVAGAIVEGRAMKERPATE